MDIYQLFFSIFRHNSFFLHTVKNTNIKTMIPIVMGTVVGHLCYNLGAQGQKLALSFSCLSSSLFPVQFSSLAGNPCAPDLKVFPTKLVLWDQTSSSTFPHFTLVEVHDPLYTATVTHSVFQERESLSGLRRHHRSDASFLPFSCTWCRHYKEKDKSKSEN